MLFLSFFLSLPWTVSLEAIVQLQKAFLNMQNLDIVY